MLVELGLVEQRWLAVKDVLENGASVNVRAGRRPANAETTTRRLRCPLRAPPGPSVTMVAPTTPS